MVCLPACPSVLVQEVDSINPAGADIQELANISTVEAHRIGWLKDLEDNFAALRKPVVAAVRGFAVSVPHPSSNKMSVGEVCSNNEG